MNDLLTLEPRDVDTAVMEPDVAVTLTDSALHDMSGAPAKMCCYPVDPITSVTGSSRF